MLWGSSSAGCPFSTCPWRDGWPPTFTRAPHPGSAFLWGQALLVQALPLVGGRVLLTHGPEPGAPSAASQGNGGHPAWGVPEGGGVPSSPLGNPSFHLSPLFLTLAEESLFGGGCFIFDPLGLWVPTEPGVNPLGFHSANRRGGRGLQEQKGMAQADSRLRPEATLHTPGPKLQLM